MPRLSESLIVLPEFFNVPGGCGGINRTVDLSVDAALRRVSLEFGVCFVAGLVEEGGRQRYNSAYLIDGAVRRLLSRKVLNDGSGNYTVAECCDCPCPHRGFGIAALICMDAADISACGQPERHQALLDRLDDFGAVPRVLCVPACFTGYDTEKAARYWWKKGIPTVIANSCPSYPSVIFVDNTPICIDGSQNAIRVAGFPSSQSP